MKRAGIVLICKLVITPLLSLPCQALKDSRKGFLPCHDLSKAPVRTYRVTASMRARMSLEQSS